MTKAARRSFAELSQQDAFIGRHIGPAAAEQAAMLTALDKVLQAPEAVQLRPETWRAL